MSCGFRPALPGLTQGVMSVRFMSANRRLRGAILKHWQRIDQLIATSVVWKLRLKQSATKWMDDNRSVIRYTHEHTSWSIDARPIKAGGNPHGHKLPAIHLPADTSIIRVVTVFDVSGAAVRYIHRGHRTGGRSVLDCLLGHFALKSSCCCCCCCRGERDGWSDARGSPRACRVFAGNARHTKLMY